jgi:uncharacterized delta-60 repeat protein
MEPRLSADFRYSGLWETFKGLMRACRLVLGTAFMLILAVPAGAAVGPFDPGFGRGGKVTFSIGEGSSLAATAPDPAGGFVLAGTGNAAAGEYALIRMGNTGRVDTSFGNWKPDRNRFFPAGSPGDDYRPAALAARPGGGWVTAGFSDVVAHRADGSLDPGFGSGGLAHMSLPGTGAGTGAVAVLADGRILVGGYYIRESEERLFVARLTAGGSMDPTWGSAGVVDFHAPGRAGLICDEEIASLGVRALRPQIDGSLLVAGTLASSSADVPEPVLARLRSDGSFDPAFGTGGIAVLTPPGGSGTTAGVVLRGGTTIVGLTVGDNCEPTLHTRFGTIAVGADGTRLAFYGQRGAAVISFPATVRAYAMAGLPGGRVALVGGIGDGIGNVLLDELAVARLTPTGQLDRAFGGGRTCGEVVGAGLDGPARTALALPGSRLLVGGNSPEEESLEFARYRSVFTRGGVECFIPEEPFSRTPLRSVRLRTILGRRGRLRLLVRRGGYASKARFRPVCLGTGGPGDVVAVWDGRVNGRSLAPGPYSLVLESRDRRGRLLGRSYIRAISLARRASGPRRSC